MTEKFLFIALVFTTSLFFTACEKDDPEIPNEEELITTLKYNLTPTGGGTSITLSFQDLDGDGGDNPAITGGNLAANQTYTGTLELLNDSKTPAESITEEIEEEKEEHQFFFQSNVSNLTIAYSDQDANGNPVGLTSILTTGAAESGTITILLRHEPNKSASGVSDGDITNAGGETDIEVTFPVNVQ
ncbi:MAG: hypothetical protein ACI8P3_003291 [Saprospiraceae bacterium]|jgi:hypothetical protein